MTSIKFFHRTKDENFINCGVIGRPATTLCHNAEYCIAYALSDDYKTCYYSWSICHPDDTYTKSIAREIALKYFNKKSDQYNQITLNELLTLDIRIMDQEESDGGLTLADQRLLGVCQSFTKYNFIKFIDNIDFRVFRKPFLKQILEALICMQDKVLYQRIIEEEYIAPYTFQTMPYQIAFNRIEN